MIINLEKTFSLDSFSKYPNRLVRPIELSQLNKSYLMSRLFVGNLNYRTTMQGLGQFMSQAGEVVGVTIPSG
ncbi:MAG: hypothetical protein EZS28_010251, partial [Streblomastix strix]